MLARHFSNVFPNTRPIMLFNKLKKYTIAIHELSYSYWYTWISDQHIPYHNSLLETIEYYHISSLLSSLLFLNTTPRHCHDIRRHYALRIFCTLKVPIRNISIYKYQAKIYIVALISTSWMGQTFFSQSYAMFRQRFAMMKTLHAKILRT